MNRGKYKECEIVQDLLPLYYDDACTSSSKKFVEEHLKSCPKCQKMYKELQNTTMDTMIQKESLGILERHARKEKTVAYKTGIIIALLLLVPIVITLLVTFSSGGDFSVFWVLVASMLLIGAFTVVPLTSAHNKLVKSIMAGVLALLLIMFFVNRMNGGGEFVLWTVPTVFGLSVPLFPVVICNIKLPVVLADKKALITLFWDTAWLYLTIFEVCNYNGDAEGMRTGFIVATVMMSGIWIAFLVIRYLKSNFWVKGGISTFIVSIWFAFSNDVITLWSENKKQLTIMAVNFSNWNSDNCVNANVYIIILIFGGLISLILLGIGIMQIIKKSRQRI